jgi:uncharacterized protein
MQQKGKNVDQRSNIMIIFLILFFILLMSFNILRPRVHLSIPNDIVQNFSTVFLSIILETMPFILLGAFISSLIQVFVSEQTIAKLIPKDKFVGLLAASLMGFIFPVCECAIIPIARRLLRKGVPTGIVVTFMLAVPIVNPVVLLSTYYAFYNKPVMVLIRGGFGLISAIVIGFFIGWLEEGKNPLKNSAMFPKPHKHDCDCGHEHYHGHPHETGNGRHKSKIGEIIDHTSSEFYDIGKYLIFGAIISASFQTFVSRGNILAVGYDKNLSVIVMILLAFVISLCSEADAFVARSFMGQFTTGSIAAFLIFGPMLDIKNTLMLNSTFKKRFTIQLMFIIFLVCFIAGVLVNKMGI